MTDTLEYQVTVMIPLNLMNLCCSRTLTLNSAKGDKYNLKETDPERLKEIIKTIQAAPESALHIVPRLPNFKMENALKKYNKSVPPHRRLTHEDVVRYISWDTYSITEVGINEDHPDDEVHTFLDVVVPGFSKNRKTKLYIKFVNPEEGKRTEVISAHRNCDS